MGIVNDLTELKTLSDGVVANKVSRFAYKENAYTNNDVNGVNTYNANQDNNIPVGTANVMKVNQTVIELGWRARASSITRMLMNHFLGRISYNLNKVNDWFNELLAKLLSSLGNPDGIALLNSNGIVPDTMLPSSLVRNVSDITPDNTGKVDLTKQTDITKILSGSLIGQIFGRLFGTYWVNTTISGHGGALALKYANGLWVASVHSNGLFWSEDGLVWTPCTGFGIGHDFEYIEYTGGLWFAGDGVGGTGGFFWSADGKDWTACTGDDMDSVMFNTSGTHNVVYAENLYVCSASTNVGHIYWSTDGKAWVRGTTTGGGRSFGRVAYGNGVWIASAGRDAGLFRSTDGKNWSLVSDLAISNYTLRPIYANGLFVIYLDKLAWSEDGLTWTSATGADIINHYPPSTLVCLNNVWFCICSSDAQEFHVLKSYDGKYWYDKATLPDTAFKFAYANGLLLIGGRNRIFKSINMGESFEQDLSDLESTTLDIEILEYGKDKWLSACPDLFALGLRRSDYSVLLEKGMLQ